MRCLPPPTLSPRSLPWSCSLPPHSPASRLPPPGRAHLETGEEIWRQTAGRVDAFVSGSGTGGTLAGVSIALKRRDPRVRIFLVDPPGSGLYNKVCGGWGEGGDAGRYGQYVLPARYHPAPPVLP